MFILDLMKPSSSLCVLKAFLWSPCTIHRSCVSVLWFAFIVSPPLLSHGGGSSSQASARSNEAPVTRPPSRRRYTSRALPRLPQWWSREDAAARLSSVDCHSKSLFYSFCFYFHLFVAMLRVVVESAKSLPKKKVGSPDPVTTVIFKGKSHFNRM